MPRLPVVERKNVAQAEPLFEHFEAVMGFLPNSMLTMAHKPDILLAASALARVVLSPGEVPAALKWLVANMVSNAAGCRYCQAHTAHSAHHLGVEAEKLDALFEYETSPHFTRAERAALKVAHGAGLSPNSVTDADFNELKTHYSTQQIVEIVAVVSLYGFLNRWNDTLATKLEASPLRFSQAHLLKRGWEVGKHKEVTTPGG